MEEDLLVVLKQLTKENKKRRKLNNQHTPGSSKGNTSKKEKEREKEKETDRYIPEEKRVSNSEELMERETLFVDRLIKEVESHSHQYVSLVKSDEAIQLLWVLLKCLIEREVEFTGYLKCHSLRSFNI